MDQGLRNRVRLRAGNRCEYRRILQESDPFFLFHIEHVIPRQHGGDDQPENLALACHHCNLHKGTNLTSIDPPIREVVPLFHPRREIWTEHFKLDGALVIGKTAIGRATANLLQMNAVPRIVLRQMEAR